MDETSSWEIYPYFCARRFKMITWEHEVLLNFLFLILIYCLHAVQVVIQYHSSKDLKKAFTTSVPLIFSHVPWLFFRAIPQKLWVFPCVTTDRPLR